MVQYEKILSDMESAGVEHSDIYKPCATLAGSNKKDFSKCDLYEGVHGVNSVYREWYELMMREDQGLDEDGKPNHRPRLSLVDFGWAKLDGVLFLWRSNQSEAPDQ